MEKFFKKLIGYRKDWWKYPHNSIDEWNILWKSSGTKDDDLTKGHPFNGPLQAIYRYTSNKTFGTLKKNIITQRNATLK
jgi:hypothetical protein